MNTKINLYNKQDYMNNLADHIENNLPVYNQMTAIMAQCIQGFVREKGGWMVETQMNSITLEYCVPIDEMEHKKITIIFEERKSSYKFSLISKIEPQSIAGGESSLLRMAENFNRSPILQNNLYFFTKPNLFSVRSTLEKDSIQIFESYQLQQYFKKIIQATNAHFTTSLSQITRNSYQESYNSAGVKQPIGMLNFYKSQLNSEVVRRSSQKISMESNYLINNFHYPNPQLKVVEDPETEEKMSRLYGYLRKIKSERSQSSKEVSDASKLLAHKIIMMKEKVDKNWKAPQSSYGSLERVQAEYITVNSFNEIASDHIDKEMKQKKLREQKLNKGVLVRKNLKTKQRCSFCQIQINPNCKCYASLCSYETQISVVSCIRNVISDNIASYFLEINDEQEKVTKFYSKYYPKCLSTEKNKAREVLPLIINLVQGLRVLDNLSILHRDLKPDNILIDSKKVPKIIDFGSAWILNRTFLKQSNLSISKKLYTTKKYNLYFEDAFFADRHNMNAAEFEQHKLYDMHAFGVIINEIFSDSEISAELGSLVLKNLSWLSTKCSIHNPNQRLNHIEVQNFCTLLLKCWNMHNQIMNK